MKCVRYLISLSLIIFLISIIFLSTKSVEMDICSILLKLSVDWYFSIFSCTGSEFIAISSLAFLSTKSVEMDICSILLRLLVAWYFFIVSCIGSRFLVDVSQTSSALLFFNPNIFFKKYCNDTRLTLYDLTYLLLQLTLEPLWAFLIQTILFIVANNMVF